MWVHGPAAAGARSTRNAVSLLELSVQAIVIVLDEEAAAVRLLGAAGILGVGVGVGAGGVGVTVGVRVGVKVGVAVAVGGPAVGVRVGVKVGVAVAGGGVGVGVAAAAVGVSVGVCVAVADGPTLPLKVVALERFEKLESPDKL